jgi:hypothetical protein
MLRYTPKEFIENYSPEILTDEMIKEIKRLRPRGWAILETIYYLGDGVTASQIEKNVDEEPYDNRNLNIDRHNKIMLALRRLLAFGKIRKVKPVWRFYVPTKDGWEKRYSAKHPDELGIKNYRDAKLIERKALYFLTEGVLNHYKRTGIFAPFGIIYYVVRKHREREKKKLVEEIRMEKKGELLEEFEI